MKLTDVATLCVVCGLVAGCEERMSKQDAGKKVDTELVNVLNNVGIENAIVAQHTLYPYHFVSNSEKLNGLGERDLDVLARHFRDYPGELSVRRGDAPEAMYESRVAQVVERLKQAGVKTDRVSIADGMPGGTGMTSERTVMILDEMSGKEPQRRRLALPDSGRIAQ